MRLLFLLKISICIVLLHACSDNLVDHKESESTSFSFPVHLGEPIIPDDNELSPERIELGRRLFYDKRLSATGEVACATCHMQRYAFSDTSSLSMGIHGRVGIRNAPTLVNVAYQPYMFMDGGTKNLETQVLAPLQDTNELGREIHELTAELNNIPAYHDLAQRAYARDLDHFVLVRALASFERTIISSNSKYDQFIRGDQDAFNAEEREGWLLFSEKLKCIACHSGPNLTNYSFQNNGAFVYNSLDSGRMRITFIEADRNKFKVPSLRNVTLTAPYMHDGSFQTLDEVIDHYQRGGFSAPNKSGFIVPNELTLRERDALKSFLNTLTDSSLINNKNLGPLTEF